MLGSTPHRKSLGLMAAAAMVTALAFGQVHASPLLPVGCSVQFAPRSVSSDGHVAWPVTWLARTPAPTHCRPLGVAFVTTPILNDADLDPASTGSLPIRPLETANARVHRAALKVAPVPERDRTAPAMLFGTVAIPVSTSVHASRWRAILDEEADRILLGECRGALCRNVTFRRLSSLAAALRGEPIEERIRKINRTVNSSIDYRTDLELYGRGDYWASFRETVLAGKGDCEDFALVKMWLLRAAGVPQDAMQLVLARDTRRQLDHAFLSVQTESGVLVLDNLTDEIEPERLAARRYQPMVSLGTAGTWIHGYRGRQG
jgi:predicted transglutaminase-like cysteine proteinase